MFSFFPKNKVLKTFVILFIVVIFIYIFYLFLGKYNNKPTINSDQKSLKTNVDNPDTSFLLGVNSLRSININESLFQNKLFTYLKDNSVALQRVTPGRPNPFAPIGGVRLKIIKKNNVASTNMVRKQDDQINTEVIPTISQDYNNEIDNLDILGSNPYFEYFDDEGYEVIIDDTNNTNNGFNNNTVTNSFDLISPTYGETIFTNKINFEFTVTGNPISCWYDLGGLILDQSVPSNPNDPVDPEYQYPLENCQSKNITLPNGDYILNLWFKYSDVEYYFESNSFIVKATP